MGPNGTAAVARSQGGDDVQSATAIPAVDDRTRSDVQEQNGGVLMEAGVEYERKRLHPKRYFAELLAQNESIGDQMRPLLEPGTDREFTSHGPADADVGTASRAQGADRSFTRDRRSGTGGGADLGAGGLGLTSALRESAAKQKRGPISKQRNRRLPCAFIEVAKIAPLCNEKLQEIHRKALEKGVHKNRATLAVARKQVAYLLAADCAFFLQSTTLPA
jgi:transposase